MELLKAPTHDPEVLVSHANAALTPRARLRLAQLVVDHGWTYAAAAKMFMVSPRTAKKWADRYRAEGAAGMTDRSARGEGYSLCLFLSTASRSKMNVCA